MDHKEFRDRMGTNQHFHPELNPQVQKPHWWNKQKLVQPIQINRPRSSTLEDATSSPVGSPSTSSPHLSASPMGSPSTHAKSPLMSASSPMGSPSTKAKGAHFDFEKQRSRSFKADDHKDSILT